MKKLIALCLFLLLAAPAYAGDTGETWEDPDWWFIMWWIILCFARAGRLWSGEPAGPESQGGGAA